MLTFFRMLTGTRDKCVGSILSSTSDLFKVHTSLSFVNLCGVQNLHYTTFENHIGYCFLLSVHNSNYSKSSNISRKVWSTNIYVKRDKISVVISFLIAFPLHTRVSMRLKLLRRIFFLLQSRNLHFQMLLFSTFGVCC